MSDLEPGPTEQSSEPLIDRPRYRQLNKNERAGAIVAGSVIGTVAFVAMFLTSNEAGIAVALLLCGALLVAGIQGTQLGKLSKDEAGFMPLEEARMRVAATATAVARSGDTEAANKILDAYESADPSARFSPPIADARSRMDALEYENHLAAALQSMGMNISIHPHLTTSRIRPDMVATLPGGITIVFEAKYYSAYRPLPANVPLQLVGLVRAGNWSGGILVTNGAISPWKDEAFGDDPIEIVQWFGDGEELQLQSAIDRLQNRLRSAGPQD